MASADALSFFLFARPSTRSDRTMLRASKIHSLLLVAAWAIPCAVLVVAYGAIAVYTGNPWPWHEVVHESGDRTLLGTILYFEHAARELPLDVLLGVACGGSAVFAFPTRKWSRPLSQKLRRGFLAAGTLTVIVVILVGTLFVGGSQALSDNLLQLHTRPGTPLEWGAHWRYHLLSRALLMLFSLGLAGMVVLIIGGKAGGGSKAGLFIFLTALGLFVALTIAFVPTLEPFLEPVYLGHQIREVFTHALVTIPAAWGVCLILARERLEPSLDDWISAKWAVVAGIGGLLIGVFLLIAGLTSSAASHGQTQSMVLLLFPHFFEHSFTYIVVPLVAGLIYESGLSIDHLTFGVGGSV